MKNISFDGIFDGEWWSRLLEENCMDVRFHSSSIRSAQDKAASGLLEGRIVLAVDNSPGVLILPATYQMFFQAGDVLLHTI